MHKHKKKKEKKKEKNSDGKCRDRGILIEKKKQLSIAMVNKTKYEKL